MLRSPDTAAFCGFEGAVGEGWIDSNGHMNVGWYDHVFDTAESRLFDAFGVNEAYILRNRQGMFRVEKSIRYERELLLGDRIRIECRVAAFNGKALRHVHQLLNVSRGGCAACAEYVSLHVDLRSRKVAQISDPAVADALAGLARRHGASVSKA